MEESELTSQAIAELLRDMSGQAPNAMLGPQERKINPLGKPNKRFLDRTINTAVRYNRREAERTYQGCRRKIQELDESYERRMHIDFYNKDSGRGCDMRRSSHRSRSRKRRKSHRRRSYSSSSSHSSSSHRRSRSKRKHRKKKHRKKEKKNKSKRRSNSHSSSNDDHKYPVSGPEMPSTYLPHPHTCMLALAVAKAYTHTLAAQQLKDNDSEQPASPLRDIIDELMSDGENAEPKKQSDTLSIASSSDDVQEIQTINLSSDNEDSSESSSSDSSVPLVELNDSSEEELVEQLGSDIEIIESEPETSQLDELLELQKQLSAELAASDEKVNQTTKESASKMESATSALEVVATVDLTED